MAAAGLAGAAAHGLWTDRAWLDSGFVSLRYARRLADQQTFLLPGQLIPAEGFLDPLWTGVLAVLRFAGLHELRLQPYAGALLFGCVVAISLFVTLRRTRRIEGVIAVGCVAAMPIMALASHSATDDLFVALLTLVTVLSVSSDLDQPEGSSGPAVWIGLFSLCGVAPLLVVSGLALTYRRHRPLWGRVVVVSLIAMSVVRMLLFGTVIPQSVHVLFGQIDASAWFEAVRLSPVLLVLGIYGLVVSYRAGERVWPVVAAVLAWFLVGLVGEPDPAGFGAVMVPVIALLALCAARGIDNLPSRWFGVLALFLLVGVDFRTTWTERAGVVHERTAAFKQAKVMTRFLRWRFEEEVMVVTQTPGILPYYLRGPTFDLTGTTHAQPVDPASVLAMGTEVMIPEGRIVSVNAERLSMGAEWDWRVVGETHYQHAIQQSRDWGLIDIHPLWFNLYMRSDLSKYRPDWERKVSKKK